MCKSFICSIWACAKWVPKLCMLSEKSKNFDEKSDPNQSKPTQRNWNLLKSPRFPWSNFFFCSVLFFWKEGFSCLMVFAHWRANHHNTTVDGVVLVALTMTWHQGGRTLDRLVTRQTCAKLQVEIDSTDIIFAKNFLGLKCQKRFQVWISVVCSCSQLSVWNCPQKEDSLLRSHRWADTSGATFFFRCTFLWLKYRTCDQRYWK